MYLYLRFILYDVFIHDECIYDAYIYDAVKNRWTNEQAKLDKRDIYD